MAGLVFLIFFVLLALGYPIIMCMIGGAITPLAMDAVGATSIAALIRGAFSGANSPNILCLPLFIFAGVLMAEGGISKKLFDVFAYFVGNKTGGMPCAVIITCLFYGAISSSGAATAAAIGAMTIPLLIEWHGYRDLHRCTVYGRHSARHPSCLSADVLCRHIL